MRAYIQKSDLEGEIKCPPGKSETHREIFLSALTDGKVSHIKNPLLGRDTIATIDACRKFGATITIDSENNLTITGKANLDGRNRFIDASNSGTTIRIATARAALGEGETELTGDSSLRTRPMMPLLNALRDLGAQCSSAGNGVPPIKVRGMVSGGEVFIDGSVSSQFISALLIFGALMEKGLTLTVLGNLVSYHYVEGTIDAMRRHGVEVRTIVPFKKYRVPNQKYSAVDHEVAGDWSSAALVIAMAALVGREVSIVDNISKSPQGDRAILGYAQQLGIRIKSDGYRISIESPKYLNGGRFDLNATPDLLPAIALFALKSPEPIYLTNVAHARKKETDRIKVICQEFSKIGIDVEEKADGMRLQWNGELYPADFDSHDDHRLFMAFSIAGMYIGNCSVSHPESVDVSYPGFVEEMKRLHAKIEVR
ncbi:MAG: 3-phosphoshikimate 1-carboxyvinyltransferase [Candidatus Micrarchaeota archaeon]|nr:3-phosphoshikimate 1-carboxyvinyltransferase [Candidatus Micrarchaeota archaeon]